MRAFGVWKVFNHSIGKDFTQVYSVVPVKKPLFFFLFCLGLLLGPESWAVCFTVFVFFGRQTWVYSSGASLAVVDFPTSSSRPL